jgi:hypothetical protein
MYSVEYRFYFYISLKAFLAILYTALVAFVVYCKTLAVDQKKKRQIVGKLVNNELERI